MNHLAHFQLSHGNDGWLVGALLGDFVKGPLRQQYPVSWEQGILLHRRIDAFTDQHPLWRQNLREFGPPFRRYGAIMLDLAADYWLCQHWQIFHHEPLDDFCENIYQLLEQHSEQLPTMARDFSERLRQHRGLENYRNWQAVEGALQRISRRLQRSNPLAEAGTELLRRKDKLEQRFLEFYPELQHYAAQQCHKLTASSGQ